LFTGSFGQNGGVKPSETEAWVSSSVPERVDQGLAAIVIVNEDVLFVVFDEGQDV
jgi:hypothetical protein